MNNLRILIVIVIALVCTADAFTIPAAAGTMVETLTNSVGGLYETFSNTIESVAEMISGGADGEAIPSDAVHPCSTVNITFSCVGGYLKANSFGKTQDGIDSSNPFVVDYVGFDFGDTGVYLDKYNVTFVGMTNAVVVAFYYSESANISVLTVNYPEYQLFGPYTIMFRRDGFEDVTITSEYYDTFRDLTTTSTFQGVNNIDRSTIETTVDIDGVGRLGYGNSFFDRVLSDPRLLMDLLVKYATNYTYLRDTEAITITKVAANVMAEYIST